MAFGRNTPVQSTDDPGHEYRAQSARTALNKRNPGGSPLEMRYQELLQANIQATLAVYDLLGEQGRGY